ncbi:hypothetical protein AeMF1_017639 [Aphanomyces euteiches]|nr:hypothetical protein AeMF1_017639 [Aphanomyces euteiches]
MATESSTCAIRVVVRVRPMSEKETASGQVAIVETASNALTVRQPPNCRNEIKETGPPRTFQFDHCYGDAECEKNVQQTIFEDIGRDLVENAFNGFNCSVFAYGQTGSGKTYTMVGDKTDAGKGLIPRICEALFDAIETAKTNDQDAEQHKPLYSVQMNYCEIYKEKVKDLLEETRVSRGNSNAQPMSPSSGDNDSSRHLRVREHPVHGPFVEGLVTRTVASYAEIEEELLAGQKLRTVAATLMNPTSSRSHAIFTIIFTQTRVDPSTHCAHEKTSKICLVDLAGSERSDTSGTSGERLKEASMINKSLFTLGRVISSLGAKERIPYRDSTLTWLLKESLGGNAKTTMLAMVSPSSENYDETLSTLRYAESAKKIINRVVVNEDQNAAIIRQLRQQIEDLKAQLLNTQRRRSSETSAGLVKSLLEREEMLGQLERETKQQQKAVHLPSQHPSLINLQEDLLEDEPLAHVVEPGVTVLGTDPSAYSKESHRAGDSVVGDLIRQQSDVQAVHSMSFVHDTENIFALHAKVFNDKGFLTIEPWPNALVLVNDVAITSFTPLKHRDRVQIGKQHIFRVFVPSEAAFRRESSHVDNQTDGAFSRCGRISWRMLVLEANALCEQANIPFRFQRADSNEVAVVLANGDASGITWEHSVFAERLETLRSLKAERADYDTLLTHLGLPNDHPVSTSNASTEKETSEDMSDKNSSSDDMEHLTIEVPQEDDDPFFQVRSNAVRLMGKARLYFGFDSTKSLEVKELQAMDRVVSVFDPVGIHVASITLELSLKPAEKPNKSSQDATTKWQVQVQWKEVRFYIPNAPEGIYVTFNAMDKTKSSSTPKATSLTGVFSLMHVFTTDVSCPKQQPAWQVLRDEFMSMDVWGWGKIPASPPSPLLIKSSSAHLTSPRRVSPIKMDVFVSVDVEERMQDGLYAPVTVKEDGTLRLSQNSSRRIVVRIVQADQRPFCFQSISQVRIAPAQNVKESTPFEAASALGSATLGGFFKRFGLKETQAPADDWTSWTTLPVRTPSQVDPEGRSIVCVLKWESKSSEAISLKGHRRVFHVALALETSLSTVPVIISTKFTTKTLAKLKRETAWWAREQVSRMHRLGHWYAVDVGHQDAGRHEVVAEKLLDHFGQGIEKLQLHQTMERFRQQIVTEINALGGVVSPDRLANMSNESFQVRQQCNEWVVVSSKYPDLVLHATSGVAMSYPNARDAPFPYLSQAISDPNPLDPYAGEMSGYLMLLNTAMAWNRRWFVLQRPLLYCYKTFAKHDVVGVMDISKCECSVEKASSLFPFSFRVTSFADKSELTWHLQASTADEMKVWTVALTSRAKTTTDATE